VLNLSKDIQHKIHLAHFVRGIPPENHLIRYRSIFELLQYRAHLQPDDVYIIFYPDDGSPVSLTYAEFQKKVSQTANLLLSNGISPGDRIATVSHNHINTVIQYFAAWSIGAVVVPINVNEEPDRINYILKNSRTKLAFVHEKYVDLVSSIEKVFIHSSMETGRRPVSTSVPSGERGHRPDSTSVPSGETGHRPISTHSALVETGLRPVFESEILNFDTELSTVNYQLSTLNSEALLVYTSGTTGLPKGVVLTQYNLLIDADGIARWHQLKQGDTMMCVLPIHHVNGTVVTLMTPIYYGGKVVLNQKFHTDKFFHRLAAENVQVVSVVPTLLQFLCHEEDPVILSAAKNLAGFKHIICGAGPLTCELALKFEDMFGLKIIHGYGLSETTCYSCFLPLDLSPENHRKWLSEYGFPSIGVEIGPNEMDIHNDKGESLPEGERGEIVIRGHNVMKYYDENPDANAKTFEFGWFRSGDEGFYRTDDKGRKFFFITGRLKELIIRGGVNIAPLEIDEVIMSHPGVKAGIAVGFDNDWYGEEVGAYVDPKENSNLTEKELLDYCRAKLPFYKTPKVIIFGSDIPVTSTGKYQRNKLKHLFSDYKTVQFKT